MTDSGFIAIDFDRKPVEDDGLNGINVHIRLPYNSVHRSEAKNGHKSI